MKITINTDAFNWKILQEFVKKVETFHFHYLDEDDKFLLQSVATEIECLQEEAEYRIGSEAVYGKEG